MISYKIIYQAKHKVKEEIVIAAYRAVFSFEIVINKCKCGSGQSHLASIFTQLFVTFSVA